MFPDDLLREAEDLVDAYRRAGLHIATAESCTGGLIAACLTEVPGSSDVVERGFVTYSNDAKTEMLGVPAELIRSHGAVSAEVAEAMVVGALEHSNADVAVSVTGIAGPSGATPGKPVGLVFIGTARKGAAPRHQRHVFAGSRADVRLASLRAALALFRDQLP
jgi:nicotinamide-nucleotide amidase